MWVLLKEIGLCPELKFFAFLETIDALVRNVATSG